MKLFFFIKNMHKKIETSDMSNDTIKKQLINNTFWIL